MSIMNVIGVYVIHFGPAIFAHLILLRHFVCNTGRTSYRHDSATRLLGAERMHAELRGRLFHIHVTTACRIQGLITPRQVRVSSVLLCLMDDVKRNKRGHW
jgi:hypothetical protein